MNAYKVNELTSVNNIRKIHVFVGPHEENLDELFSSNPRDTRFSSLFNEEDLANIAKMNIPVKFSQQYLHQDDSIGTIKTKIAHSCDNTFSLDEVFLFARKQEKLNAPDVYRILTQNNKMPITKNRLENFLKNVPFKINGELTSFSLKDNKSVKGTDTYTYEDILDLKLDEQPFLVNKQLGQKYFMQDGVYPFVCDPFELATYDNTCEKEIRKSISTLNNNVLLATGKIANNNIYCCLAKDVLTYSDTAFTLDLYFSLLKTKDINSLDELEEKQAQLITESKKKYDASLQEKVNLFYQIYSPDNSITYSEKGIRSIHLVVRQIYAMKIPTNVLFKVIHATQELPYIKYNPGTRQEKMVRLFCDKVTTTGKKIPSLSQALINNFGKNLVPKNRAMSLFFQDPACFCEFDENGDISLQLDFSDPQSEIQVNEIIRNKINPQLQIIQRYLEQHGYKIHIFEDLRNQNVDMKSINYYSLIPIKKKFDLSKIMGCISSLFVVENDSLEKGKGIQMRFKRISNFNKMTSIEAFILEKQKEGNRDELIVSKVLENYPDVKPDEAISILGKLASEMQIERGSRKNIIDVKSNPGFKTEIQLNSISGELGISINNINDVQFLDVFPIYIESMVRLTQSPKSLPLSAKKINSICSNGKTADETAFDDIIPLVEMSMEQKSELKELEGIEKEKEENVTEGIEIESERMEVGQREKIDDALDLFFGDDSEEEDEEEDEESEINDDQEFIGGENTSNDKNDDENEDDENVVRNIEGLKLKSPYYFQDRMEKRDEVLFLKTDQGRFNSYSRTCHMNTRRQPVILNQRELDKINKEHPGFLKDEDIIKYGSNPDKKYYYICPRYWDLEKNTIVTPEEMKEKGLENKINPMDANVVLPGKSIYEFNRPRDYKPDFKQYPGFMVDKHPDGYCIPCCFNYWNTEQAVKRRAQCSGPDNSKTPKKTEEDDYIKGPNKFPLAENRWGYLPTGLQTLLGHKQKDCVPNSYCILRHGVEVSKNQSFLACIADAIFYTKKEVPRIKDIKEIIISTLTLDTFLSLQNGTLVKEFYNQEKVVDTKLPKYMDSKIYARTRDSPEKIAFFKRICVSYECFLTYLRNDTETIDYTYLWDLLCSPHPNLFENGINLVILDVPLDDITENVNVVCPTNHYTSKKYNPSKPTLILYKQKEYFEPIYSYRLSTNNQGGQDKLFIGKLFRENNADNIPEIKFLFEKVVKPFYEKMCKPRASLPKIYKAKPAILLDLLIEVCKEHRYEIKEQVLNYEGKVIGLVVRPADLSISAMIPCFPSSIQKDYGYQFMLDPSLWRDYKTTMEVLQYVNKDTMGVVPSAPIFKVVDDEVVVGIITQTNQFVQLSKPEPVSNTSDNLREMRNNNYVLDKKAASLVSSDAILTSSDDVDTERVNYVKRINLETNFYLAFRNTIRTLLNDPQFHIERSEIEKASSRLGDTYSIKLKEVDQKLRDLAGSYAVFVKDYNYQVINDIHTCVVNKDKDKCAADAPLCAISSNGKCQIILPKSNLLNKSDNEKNYFARMADELIRYKRIRQFMFQPQVYLSFGKVDYKLNKDEIVIMQSMLNRDFFEGRINQQVNTYAIETAYDNVNPQKSAEYSNIARI